MPKKFVERPTFVTGRSMLNSLLLLALALMTVGQTGCGAWRQAKVGEAMMITYRDHVWSRRAYNLRYKNCKRPYGRHFENGFRAGYTDVAQGGDGYVPALPPAEYRGYEFQSADGARCVSAWFEGYPAGVKAAKRDKTGDYNDILISKMVDAAITQESTKAKLPGDVPVVSSRPAAHVAAKPAASPTDRSANYTEPQATYTQPPASVQAPTAVPQPQQVAPSATNRTSDGRALPPIRPTFTPVPNTPMPPGIPNKNNLEAPPQAMAAPVSEDPVEPANFYAMPPTEQALPAGSVAGWEAQNQVP